MKIVHLTPYYAPAYAFGGVVRAVEGIARTQASMGHEVCVLTTDAHSQTERSPAPSNALQDGVRVLRARNLSVYLRGRLNLSSALGLRALAAQALTGADVLHVHEFRTAECLQVAPLAAGRRVPLVLSPHGTLAQSTGRSTLKRVWDATLSPLMARHFAHVVALTADERADVQALWSAWGGRAQFHTLPNGVHLSEFAVLPPPSAFREQWSLGRAQVILFMARLHPRKGAHILLEAFLQAGLPNTVLVIAGPDEGQLAALQAQANGHPQVVFTGYLDANARLAALAAADVFVLAAEGEGLPISVLEALAAGVPALISDGCYLPEVREAGAGLVVERTAAAVGDGLRVLLLADDARKTQMRQAARDLVARRFTWQAVAQSLAQVYAQIGD